MRARSWPLDPEFIKTELYLDEVLRPQVDALVETILSQKPKGRLAKRRWKRTWERREYMSFVTMSFDWAVLRRATQRIWRSR